MPRAKLYVDTEANVDGKSMLTGEPGFTSDTKKLVVYDGTTKVKFSNDFFLSTWYWADTSFYAKTVGAAADRYIVLSPNAMQIDIGGSSYVLTSQATINLSLEATWDTISGTDYRTAANRAGKDFYIYAVHPVSGLIPSFKISANSTVPSGYSASTSRKLGGFHCLCVAAGTISSHPASGYLAGDIIPNSVWDLKFRSSGLQAGMAYVNLINKWVFIYLQSGTSTTTASINGATITDTRMWYDHCDDVAAVGCFLPTDSQFQIFAEGSNQGTNINGGGDPVTTGGHVDSTTTRRMISNFFLEDCCGVLSQWLQDHAYQPGSGSAGWKNVVGGTKGQIYLLADNAEVRVSAGGDWANGVNAGSRSRGFNSYSWLLVASIGARGLSDNVVK